MWSAETSSLRSYLGLTRVLPCYGNDSSGYHLSLGLNVKIEQSYYLPESAGSLEQGRDLMSLEFHALMFDFTIEMGVLAPWCMLSLSQQ